MPGRRQGVSISFGRLRQARLEAGLSLAQLAGSTCTRQHVCLIERGRARPSMPILQALAARLGYPTEMLLTTWPAPDHWPGCWRQHHTCAIALIERLLAGIDDHREALVVRNLPQNTV
jgi:transcriptional regulator with XRE-family HTH domain